MRSLSTIVALLLALLLLRTDCLADAPAAEFFAIESAKLAKLALADAKLASLSTAKLTEIIIVHGSYAGGLAMRFQTATFRIDARFGGSADAKGGAQRITYHIVTEDWKSRIAVLLRFLDLKR